MSSLSSEIIPDIDDSNADASQMSDIDISIDMSSLHSSSDNSNNNSNDDSSLLTSTNK
jgi:hypothetical protein